MSQLSTIEVYMDGVESSVIINESDFDPKIHRKEESDPTAKESEQKEDPKAPKAPRRRQAAKPSKAENAPAGQDPPKE